MLNFYYEPPFNYKFRKLLGDNSWSKSDILISDCSSSLMMEIDEIDNIHLIYQNKSGSIMYCIFDGENLRGQEMLKSRTNEQYERHFKIVPTTSSIHFFYVLQKDNTSSLIHQSLNNKEFSMPKILGNLPANNIRYEVTKDSSDTLHAFFVSEKTEGNIEYKKQYSGRETWSDSLYIKCNPGKIAGISCTQIKDSTLNLIYQLEDVNLTSSIILKQIKDNMVSSEDIKVIETNKAYSHVEIKNFMNKCVINMIDNNYCYVNQIENNKLLWEASKKIPLLEYKFCHYNSVYPFESISIEKTPVFLGKGISIPIIEKLNLDLCYKNLVQNELLEMKYKMSSLEKQLYNKYNEIDKLHVRLKYLESTKK